ncbi:MAG TPA: L-idonate 5-dehydrogenase [Beijerinckiaceae bacterium]|nr:L-idonate 5-dehydrogenase [Beijerinckiaceae bacterium]
MRAIVLHGPHDLRIEPFQDLPPAPAAGEVRVQMAAGGICGSDLHYYHHGGFGVVRVKQPMALGHEASGRVVALGAGVSGLKRGQLVAVNPSVPCNNCDYCRRGLRNHCENMMFNGSAMRFPHVQGMFREFMDVTADRAFAMPEAIVPEEAALCEPLSVVLHAANQAGDLQGRSVLVSGCGPIGVIAVAVARLRGAARIIATDITPHSLEIAEKLGADETINVATSAERLAAYATGKGTLDVVFECSGAAPAIAAALATLRPKGRMVFVGLGGDAPLNVNMVVAREIELVGTFRFDAEFAEAAHLIGTRTLDLSAAISATYPFGEAVAAFEHAGDRTRATKVAINLEG